MQRLTRCVVFLGALAFAWACSGDPTDNEATPTLIVATPEVMTVAQGDSQAVITSVVDEDGQGLQAEFSVSDVGSGIEVNGPDPDFLPVLGGNPIGRQARFFVKGVDLGVKTTFTVNASGLTKVVTVTVVPAGTDLSATFSNTSPALGESITMTMPAGTMLTAGSVITFGGAKVNIVSVAPDGSSVILFVPPNLTATPATVTKVALTGNPALTFTLQTTEGVTTPVVDAVPSTLSTTTPAGNEAVTLTSTDPAFTFAATATVLVGSSTNTFISSIAADGSSITFFAPTGVTGNVSVNGVIVSGFSLTLPSAAPDLTGPAPIAGTDAPVTAPLIAVPAVGATTLLHDGGTFAYDAPLFGTTFKARLYKLVVPTGRDIAVTLTWKTGEDLGVYWFLADGTTEAAGLNPADAKGGGAAGSPESSTSTFAAGTFLLAVVTFDNEVLPLFQIKMDGQ